MNLPTKIATAAGALVVAGAVALAVAPAIASAGQPAPTASATDPSYGSDAAVWKAAPFEDATDYAGLKTAWTRTVAAWPLPVPEAHPFPENPPLTSLNQWDNYTARTAAERANFWWLCAASVAVVDARAAGDSAVEQRWTDAINWWGSSDTRAITFGDDGSKTIDRVEWQASECAASPWWTREPITPDTPLTELPEWAQTGTVWLIYPDGLQCEGTEGCPNDYRAAFGQPGDVLPEGVEYYDPAKHDYNPETGTGIVFPAEQQ